MPDFSHLEKYAVTAETTAEFTFSRLQGDPSVVLAPAHECNPGYHQARLAATLELADKLSGKKPGKITPAELIQQANDERDQDRKLIAYHCARSWGENAPTDAQGNAVEFTPDNCFAFFKALPPEMFDPLRGFAGNLLNFFPERNGQLGEENGASLGN